MVDEKVILAGLLGAITWNLITLVLGLPTSSSHALIAGYGGAAVAHAGFQAIIFGGWLKPVLFIFLSPLVGMLVAILVTVLTSWIVRRQRPLKVDRWFRRLQLISAALYSLGHGTNDAQKGMGIITAALVTGGLLKTFEVPYWVIICCHLAMAGGTMAGGWRIIKTMGQRITKLNPFGGFAAETARDRKSTRLNSSHGYISDAVFFLKKKNRIRASAHKCQFEISAHLRGLLHVGNGHVHRTAHRVSHHYILHSLPLGLANNDQGFRRR